MLDPPLERWEDPPPEWWWLRPIPWRIIGTVLGLVLLVGLGGVVIVVVSSKVGPAILSIIAAVIGSAGVIFSALRYSREESQAVISTQSQILNDQQRLNNEIQMQLEMERAKREVIFNYGTDRYEYRLPPDTE